MRSEAMVGIAMVLTLPVWVFIGYRVLVKRAIRNAAVRATKAKISALTGIPAEKMVVASTGPMLYDGNQLWHLTDEELAYLQDHHELDYKEQGDWVRRHREHSG
jgi:hypothetical protein